MRRRLFLGGLVAAIAAPAIVARSSIMAVRPLRPVSGLQLLVESENRMIEAFREAIIRGQVGTIDRFRIFVDPADHSDHAAVARYERKGGHVLVHDVQIIHAQEYLRWL